MSSFIQTKIIIEKEENLPSRPRSIQELICSNSGTRKKKKLDLSSNVNFLKSISPIKQIDSSSIQEVK